MAEENDELLAKVKNILYLDGTADDGLIKGYLLTASQFIKNAVGDNEKFYVKEDVKPLFESAVTALAATYYQYRVALSDTQTYSIDLTVNSIIGQLRGLYASEGDDDETTN